MFKNYLEESKYITPVTDERTGNTYVLHMFRTENAPEEGCIVYDMYLSDTNPNHDILVGIGHKVFANDDYNTEDERLDALKDIIDTLLFENYDRVHKILNIEI